jgi:hypothetical protein
LKRRRPENDNITLPGTAATGVFSTSTEVRTFDISKDYIKQVYLIWEYGLLPIVITRRRHFHGEGWLSLYDN